MSIRDRAAGAVMGALIGEALGVGPHWYYDLEELRRDYGAWISGYTEPKPHRYHAGLKAGQLSQAGLITTMLLRSVVEKNGYDEEDFAAGWMRNSFRSWMGRPGVGRAATPASRSAKLGGGAWGRRSHGKKRAAAPIPPKRPSAPWCWLRVTPKRLRR